MANRQPVTAASTGSSKFPLNSIWLVCSTGQQRNHFQSNLQATAKDNWQIYVVEKQEFLPKCEEMKFPYNLKDYFEQCRTRVFGRLFLYGPSVTSTQTLMRDELPPLPQGTLFVADQQTSGKGRGSNVWTSPPGCLLFSFKCELAKPQLIPFVQYLACLALVHAIARLHPEVEVRIKWPNDIYTTKGQKIGGILCQSTFFNANFDITIGIGLNVSNPEPTTCLVSMLQEALQDKAGEDVAATDCNNPVFTREGVMASFMCVWEEYFEIFTLTGFSSFREPYLQAWLHSGQKVKLKQEAGVEGKHVIVESISLENGYLVAADSVDSSKKYELHPDGHSLDWMAGLLVHKVLPAVPTRPSR